MQSSIRILPNGPITGVLTIFAILGFAYALYNFSPAKFRPGYTQSGIGVANAKSSPHLPSWQDQVVFRPKTSPAPRAEDGSSMSALGALKDKLRQIQRERESLNAMSEELRHSLSDLAEEMRTYKEQMASLRKSKQPDWTQRKEFTLREGEAVELVAETFVLGVRSVFRNFVSATINNQQNVLYAGTTKTYSLGGDECRLLLTTIDSAQNMATFSFSCKE